MAEDIARMEFERAYAGLQNDNKNDKTDSVCKLPSFYKTFFNESTTY